MARRNEAGGRLRPDDVEGKARPDSPVPGPSPYGLAMLAGPRAPSGRCDSGQDPHDQESRYHLESWRDKFTGDDAAAWTAVAL